MKNFIQCGETITLAAPYDVLSGAGFLVGDVFAVASYDALSGANVEGVTEGVFELPKAAGAISQGAKVYWNDTNKNVTTTALGATLIGVATVAAANGDTTAYIRLNGSF